MGMGTANRFVVPPHSLARVWVCVHVCVCGNECMDLLSWSVFVNPKSTAQSPKAKWIRMCWWISHSLERNFFSCFLHTASSYSAVQVQVCGWCGEWVSITTTLSPLIQMTQSVALVIVSEAIYIYWRLCCSPIYDCHMYCW